MNILLVSGNAYDISLFRLFAQKNGLLCFTAANLSDCHRYVIRKNWDIIVFDRTIIGQGTFSIYTHLHDVSFSGIALVYNDTSVTQPLCDYWTLQNITALSCDNSGFLHTIIGDLAAIIDTGTNGLQHIFSDIHTIRPQSRKVLNMFMEKSDGILQIHTISTRLWGEYNPIKKSSVYACISELRKILQDEFHGATQLIKTEKETYMLKIQDYNQDAAG